jgi:hypothetical protein
MPGKREGPPALQPAQLLHQINRVNLDVDLSEVCAALSSFGKRDVNRLTKLRAVARLDENLYAMFAAKAREGRGRGAEYATGAFLIRFFESLFEFGSSRLHAPEIFAVNEKRGQSDERRIVHALAIANLFVVEAHVILLAGVKQSVMVRMIGLNEDAACALAAPRPARHLRD